MYTEWETKRDAYQKELLDKRIYSNCGSYPVYGKECNFTRCDNRGLWEKSGVTEKCNVLGCKDLCQLTNKGLDIEFDKWIKLNPKPVQAAELKKKIIDYIFQKNDTRKEKEKIIIDLGTLSNIIFATIKLVSISVIIDDTQKNVIKDIVWQIVDTGDTHYFTDSGTTEILDIFMNDILSPVINNVLTPDKVIMPEKLPSNDITKVAEIISNMKAYVTTYYKDIVNENNGFEIFINCMFYMMKLTYTIDDDNQEEYIISILKKFLYSFDVINVKFSEKAHIMIYDILPILLNKLIVDTKYDVGPDTSYDRIDTEDEEDIFFNKNPVEPYYYTKENFSIKNKNTDIILIILAIIFIIILFYIFLKFNKYI